MVSTVIIPPRQVSCASEVISYEACGYRENG